MKIDFIYQNFYIFTNKKYVINLKLYKNPIKCYYKIDHQNIKKIFKYYCSLTNVYYSDDLLYNALQYNKFKIMDLVY